MDENHNIFLSRKWVVKEAKKILERAKDRDFIILETGYGPSSTPHLGTVAEVVRTHMVARALRTMCRKDIIVISFVDNMDGMRKIAPNIPNCDMLKENINKPLCNVPDPFGKYESFAEYSTETFHSFIKNLGYQIVEYRPTKSEPYSIEKLRSLCGPDKCITIRSSDMYYSGSFDVYLIKILQNYQKILDIVLPTLGPVRQKTYSPFMPISTHTGRVIETGVKKYIVDECKVVFEEDGKEFAVPVTGGNCKLQWKIDFGMRWAAMPVDYELVGKDINEGTVPISSKLCNILDCKGPILMTYELFLDKNGEKMSKTKGNGVTVEDFFKYTPKDVIRHFMFGDPRSTKRVDDTKFPAYTDEYLKDLVAYHLSRCKNKHHSQEKGRVITQGNPGLNISCSTNDRSTAFDNLDFGNNSDSNTYTEHAEESANYKYAANQEPTEEHSSKDRENSINNKNISKDSYTNNDESNIENVQVTGSDVNMSNDSEGIDYENPIWYIKFEDKPSPTIDSSTAIGMIQSSQSKSIQTSNDFNQTDLEVINAMTNFYFDKSSPPSFLTPPEWVKKYLSDFLIHFEKDSNNIKQTIYELGKQAIADGHISDLREWFETIYRCIFGQAKGPRLDTFFVRHGLENTRKLFKDRMIV